MGGNLTFNDNDDVQLKGATDGTLVGNIGDRLKVDANFSVLPSVAVTSTVPPGDVSTTGTISSLNGTVQLAISGYKSHAIVLTGTWVATCVFEVSSDNGATWNTSSTHGTSGSLLNLGVSFTTIKSTLTTNGTYKTNSTGGNTDIRVRASAYTSGTINVRLVETDAQHLSHFGQMNITQAVVESTNNGSTSNLSSGASFTGTSDSTLAFGAIQVNLFATQKCTVQVQQSTDNTNWDIVDTYIVPANTGDGRTIQAVASWFRVIVTNNGASSTTSFRLQTVLAPIIECLPRSLTQAGNLKVESLDISKNSYSACASGFVPPAAATDVFTITGSATKVIRVTRIELSGTTTAGSGTDVNCSLIRRSTPDSGGVRVADTVVSHDTTNPSGTATVGHYTTNPTLGTSLGAIRAVRLPIATVGAPASTVDWDFGVRPSQAVVLRGTSEQLCVNFGGGTITGPVITIYVEWTEE